MSLPELWWLLKEEKGVRHMGLTPAERQRCVDIMNQEPWGQA